MCGIGGFVGEGMAEEELTSAIHQVSQQLRHRGPDDYGYLVSDGVALCATRLAIRDIEHGMQPMTKEGVTIVFNGEIYNTEELREECQGKLVTQCDTEVVLEGYLRFGSMIFEKLSGMFAIAIWDSRKKALFLARDRWGEKPLYYAQIPSGIVFSSEICGLKPWKKLKWDIVPSHIQTFLRNSHIPAPHTGWEHIVKLKAGHYLHLHNGTTTLKRYHFPTVIPATHTPDRLRDLLINGVNRTAISERPLGAFLSGGLDSSIIVTLLKRIRTDFPVFSIDWKEPDYSEACYSSILCKHLGLRHEVIQCRPQFLVDHFDKIVSIYGEPFGDESMIPTFCLSKRAKEEVDVVLTGDGADEFFHGYERYFFDKDPDTYVDIFSAMDPATCELIFSKDFSNFIPIKGRSFCEEWSVKEVSRMRERSLEDIQNHLPDGILTKLDRATMAVGLEARSPFLMPEITAFALNCSLDLLIGKGGSGKRILKEAVKDLVPPEICERKKQGFGVPLGAWFSGELESWMKERLFSGVLLKTGWFSLKGLQQIAQNPKNYSRAIYNLLVLESWLSPTIKPLRPVRMYERNLRFFLCGLSPVTSPST